MEINRNNYEAYFIDYLEGNLDERLVDSFLEFLKLNPDLKEELALFESVNAVPENISFRKKDDLYKEKFDSEEEFNNAAIASLEGDITDLDKFEFETYLDEHPEKKQDAALFSKTKLKPDISIVFSKKNKLYKKSVGKTILLWSGRVAAVLILAVAFFTLMNNRSEEIIPENEVVVINEISDPENEELKKDIDSESKKVVPVEEKKKKVTEKNKPVKTKPESTKIVPEKKPKKSIRETTKGRIDPTDLAFIRTPVEIPAEMIAIRASIDTELPRAELATMYLKYPDDSFYNYDEVLLADIVKEKTGLDKFKFNKITKAGLNLVSGFTRENFSYKTNENGNVTEYNYDSRILAFSIPKKRLQLE